MWTGTGRSLGAPAQTSPAQTPDFRILYCKYGMPGGPRRGISFGGRTGFMMFEDGRGREATAGDLSARQVIESVPSRSAPAADIGRRTGCLKPGDGQKKANPEQPILPKKTVSRLDCLFWQRKSIHNGQNAGHCRHSVRQKRQSPGVTCFFGGRPPPGGAIAATK